MALRSFIASIEIEIVVVVDDADPDPKRRVQRLAYSALGDEVVTPEDFQVGRMSHMPAGYEGDSMVYAEDLDMTAAEAAKLPGGYACESDPVAAERRKRAQQEFAKDTTVPDSAVPAETGKAPDSAG